MMTATGFLRMLLWPLACCLAMLALVANIVAADAQVPPAGGPVAESDRQFLLQAAASGLYELEVARLAELRAINPMVKAYAAMLALHQTALNDDVKNLAATRGLVLPDGPDRERRDVIEALAALPPGVFDNRFVQQVGITDHQAEIVVFERASRGLSDAELRAWAVKALQARQQHLAAAQHLPQLVQTMVAAAAALPA